LNSPLILKEQRNLLNLGISQTIDTNKLIPLPVIKSESATQTEDYDLKDFSGRKDKGLELVQDKGSDFEHEYKMLQRKYMSEKKVHDESQKKLFQELIDAKKQLNECIHTHEKLKTEKDLALQEVDELRKLLSISRSALACIQDTPSSSIINTPLLPQHFVNDFARLKVSSEKNTEAVTTEPFKSALVVPYLNHGKTRFQPTKHDTLDLNYHSTKNNNDSYRLEEYITINKTEALIRRLDTHPEKGCVCEPIVSETIQPNNYAYNDIMSAKLEADNLVEMEHEDRISTMVSLPTLNSCDEDNLDTTSYGSCEFDEESEI